MTSHTQPKTGLKISSSPGHMGCELHLHLIVYIARHSSLTPIEQGRLCTECGTRGMAAVSCRRLLYRGCTSESVHDGSRCFQIQALYQFRYDVRCLFVFHFASPSFSIDQFLQQLNKMLNCCVITCNYANYTLGPAS